ncbi:MAG: hypothetical protein IJ217_05765 [Clostridia bacterium]|nr:hypothetical protein [Clostridia bacterium]
MKIIHWAIIFVVIVVPFSVVCRNTIQKKTLVLEDQTRIDNILDNATYDAVTQIIEVSEELGYGKNIPITRSVAMASIDRFFQSMAVNFNMPSNVEVAKDYFGQYIPAILIIGYDGLYVYSYDYTASEGYHYVLKPKVPYSYTDLNTGLVINFTLGNDLKVYLPNENKLLEGYVGTLDASEEVILNNSVSAAGNSRDYIINTLPYLTSNLSYILGTLATRTVSGSSVVPSYMYDVNVAQDYEYDEKSEIVVDASRFHILRRETIINLIIATLQQEVNEHETYADLIGVNYNFNIPDIDKDQWNNTIDDISVLAFFQGMPIGTDSFYNNYSLGGARIVQANYIYATADGKYHRHNCPLINEEDPSTYEQIFINVYHAIDAGYHACEVCR